MPFQRSAASSFASIASGSSGRCTAPLRRGRRRTMAIRLRPPFRVVWSRGLGSLIEFPAVVSDGVAYIGNVHGTIRALSMRNGTVLWRHDTKRGKMAASPAVVGDELVVHGMDGDRPRARPPHRPPALGEARRLADRELAARPRPDRLLRRVGRQRLRARPAHAPAALGLPLGLQDHLERRARRPHALHRRLRRPAARARARERAAALAADGQRPDLRHAGSLGRAASSCRPRTAAR